MTVSYFEENLFQISRLAIYKQANPLSVPVVSHFSKCSFGVSFH